MLGFHRGALGLEDRDRAFSGPSGNFVRIAGLTVLDAVDWADGTVTCFPFNSSELAAEPYERDETYENNDM